MSGAHAHALYFHGHSRVHRLAPECKLAAQLLFVLVVVSTPREAIWAFGLYAVILIVVIRLAELPLGFVLKRLAIELPFVGFALLLPFIARGQQIEVLGLSVSVEGLWGAWNILVKGTLGVAASIVVASTTTMAELLKGLDRLHLPKAFTSIGMFMVRYLDVISGEMQRMRIARQSRGYNPRWIWEAKAVAHSAGALFIRSYERGERVYLAMLSRGYTGEMPSFGMIAATRQMWVVAMTIPVLALAICLTAWGVRP
ncbi:MAG: cobalt ECF transporter T component CbiQ [Actinomycetota bacterium]